MAEASNLPEVRAGGLLFIPDPHLAHTPPGQRNPGYMEQVLAKVASALESAREMDLAPVILGDLFHRPRDNANILLVELIALFGRHKPWVLVGNHDKYQARYTDDVSMAVLDAAGVIRLLARPGPAFVLQAGERRILVGASPDGTRLPSAMDPRGFDQVVWCTHHNIGFPDFEEKRVRIREIPGVDWVVNGHIHRPQPTVVKGGTRWANPGNIVRLTFSRRSLERTPAAHAWRPEAGELVPVALPVAPFAEVFPDQELPAEPLARKDRRSMFLDGLERLRQRRSREGRGLKEFLELNLSPEADENPLIWELYKEVVDDQTGE
jgi:predicted phosphodiesterase